MARALPAGFQKSPVRFTAWFVDPNLPWRSVTCITFAIMQRSSVKYVIEFIIHALFWLGMYYALRALTVSSFKMLINNNGQISGQVNGNMLFPYSKVVLAFLIVLFYTNIFWLFQKVIHYKSKVLSIAIISGCGWVLFAIDFWLVRTLINHDPRSNAALPGPPGAPVGAFSARDWSDMQLTTALIFLSVLGIAVAYFFIKAWIRNELVRNQAEALQLSTEIRFLRSQVNPHFLFNTLNNLFSMAQKRGDDEVADGISKLSGMMRYMIYESNTDSVPLQKEIEYLDDCIRLSKLRYADDEVSVSFLYPVQADITGVQVAPMLFIPFLENAFKHGVSIGGNSSIVISFSVNQKKLTFTCENSIHNAVKKLEEEKGGIGLENVKRRLELLYPGRHELQARPEGENYKVTLKIDLS